MQRLDVADPPVLQALAGHATQLAFSHVEPTAVLGSVNEVDPPHVLAGLLWWKRFVKRPLRVRVQVIAHQRDSLDAGVARIQQMGDFASPIVLGAALLFAALAKAGKRLKITESFCFVFASKTVVRSQSKVYRHAS